MQNENEYEIATHQTTGDKKVPGSGQGQSEYVQMELKEDVPYQTVKPKSTTIFIEGQDAPAVPQRNAVAPSSPLRSNSEPTEESNPSKSTQLYQNRVDALLKVTAVLGLTVIAFATAAVMLYLEQQSELKEVREKLTRQYSELSTASESRNERIKTVEAKMDEQRTNTSNVISKANERMEFIESRCGTCDNLSKQYSELSNASESKIERIKALEAKIDDFCPIKYNDKCYWIGRMEYKAITLDMGRRICEAQNGKVAEIYSKEHYYMLIGYLRIFASGDEFIDAWTGMTYDDKDRKVLLSNGTEAPFYLWYPGYPATSYCCGILLRVTSQYDEPKQHLHNANRGFFRSAVICEK